MTDVTMQVIEAQEARSRMQEAKKRIKAEVRRKYEAQMNLEIAERSQDAEIEFARTLARVHASGVPQSVLRRDVLRTNVWGVWTYWRDLAQIEPERVTISNAKEATRLANAPYRWEKADTEFGWALVLTKDEAGNAIEPEAVLTYIVEEGGNLVAWPDLSLHRWVWEKHWNNNGSAMKAYASKLANAHRKEIDK